MQGKTHLFTGMAAAIALCSASDPAHCALALAGGALGGVFADVDRLRNDKGREALKGQLASFGLILLAMASSSLLNWGFFEYTHAHIRSVGAGLAGLVLLWAVGVFMPHRGFTHSLAAMLMASGCARSIYPDLFLFVLAGYASHLLLDLLNKKGLRFFWPHKRGVCLNVCRADGAADRLFLWMGMLAAAGLTAVKLLKQL